VGLVVGAVALSAVAFFEGPIRVACCAPDPDLARRQIPRDVEIDTASGGIRAWSPVPVLWPDGTATRVDLDDLADLRHGACRRDFELIWLQAPQGTRKPMPNRAGARITWDCLVTARHRTTGQHLRAVLRLVEDPRERADARTMLQGPALRARLADLGAP
jgi:hypothetical protein